MMAKKYNGVREKGRKSVSINTSVVAKNAEYAIRNGIIAFLILIMFSNMILSTTYPSSFS